MKVTFNYEKEKDIWCILNKGKSSHNSQSATKVYLQLVQRYGDSLTEKTTSLFVHKYLSDNAIRVEKYVSTYQEEWNTIADDYQKIAKHVFGVSLPHDVTGYLTINNRCPYSIENNYFFVAMPTISSVKTTMHELWHFYTWQKFGIEWEEKIGKQKYNDIKEALTVLINVECKNLLPEGVTDNGYPQHKELREEVLRVWQNEKNINTVWKKAVAYLNSNQG